jgi:16S rRNA (cytidine1402-2'-O)-methyltransferase
MPGTLFVVATPIGNLEDVTARALRVLREVSLIAAEDTRRTSHLLSRYGITTPTTSIHEHNEHQKTPAIIARLEAGESVALVSDAGTPAISDPGAHLIGAATARGVTVSPIPGPSAILTLLSVIGLEVGQFTFLGFPPTRSSARKQWLDRLVKSAPLAIFYEAPHRIRETLAEVQRLLDDPKVVIGRELTKAHEQLVKGQISGVIDSFEAKGEFVIAVSVPTGGALVPLSEAETAALFVQLTNTGTLTRRQAISTISRRHGVSAREVYSAIEKQRKSVG